MVSRKSARCRKSRLKYVRVSISNLLQNHMFGLQFVYFNFQELVDTGVAGRFPCGFLYKASAEGFMPASLCGGIQDNVAEFCCTLPVFDITGEF
jgi:hypothetical protein